MVKSPDIELALNDAAINLGIDQFTIDHVKKCTVENYNYNVTNQSYEMKFFTSPEIQKMQNMQLTLKDIMNKKLKVKKKVTSSDENFLRENEDKKIKISDKSNIVKKRKRREKDLNSISQVQYPSEVHETKKLDEMKTIKRRKTEAEEDLTNGNLSQDAISDEGRHFVEGVPQDTVLKKKRKEKSEASKMLKKQSPSHGDISKLEKCVAEGRTLGSTILKKRKKCEKDENSVSQLQYPSEVHETEKLGKMKSIKRRKTAVKTDLTNDNLSRDEISEKGRHSVEDAPQGTVLKKKRKEKSETSKVLKKLSPSQGDTSMKEKCIAQGVTLSSIAPKKRKKSEETGISEVKEDSENKDEDQKVLENPLVKRVKKSNTTSIPAENGMCPPGYRIHQNRCFECFPGSYTSGQASECFLCPKDFFMPKKAADSCWPCPQGKKTVAQGADSEEDCVYFGENGQPVAGESPPWALILSLAGALFSILWCIAIFLLYRWFIREKKDKESQILRLFAFVILEWLDDMDKKISSWTEKPYSTAVESGDDLLSETQPFQSSSDEHQYESISDDDSSDPDDHHYGEIGDFEYLYEEPLKPSKERTYADITGSDKKPGRRKRPLPSIPSKSQSVDSDSYLIPNRKPSENEVPIKRSAVPDRIKEEGRGGSEELYDDVAEDDDEGISKSYSLGFEPAVAASAGTNREPSESNENLDKRKETDARKPRQPRSELRKTKSGERRDRIPEDKAENSPSGGVIYDEVAETPSENNVAEK